MHFLKSEERVRGEVQEQVYEPGGVRPETHWPSQEWRGLPLASFSVHSSMSEKRKIIYKRQRRRGEEERGGKER